MRRKKGTRPRGPGGYDDPAFGGPGLGLSFPGEESVDTNNDGLALVPWVPKASVFHALESGVTASAGSPTVSKAQRSLKDYCSGSGGGGSGSGAPLREGQRVEAEYLGLGNKYPGEVIGVNPDGTVDIMYDDNWVEKGVPKERVFPVTAEDQAEAQARKRGWDVTGDPGTDPLCQMKDEVDDLQDDISSAYDDIKTWKASMHRRRSSARREGKKDGEWAKSGDGGDGDDAGESEEELDEGVAGADGDGDDAHGEKGAEGDAAKEGSDGKGEEGEAGGADGDAAEEGKEGEGGTEGKKKVEDGGGEEQNDGEAAEEGGEKSVVEGDKGERGADDVDKLRRALAERDEEISDLLEQLKETDAQLAKELEEDARQIAKAKDPEQKDKEISELKAKVHRRDMQIRELHRRLSEDRRRTDLVPPRSDEEIAADAREKADEIESKLKNLRERRKQMEVEHGSLDPELHKALDEMIDDAEKAHGHLRKVTDTHEELAKAAAEARGEEEERDEELGDLEKGLRDAHQQVGTVLEEAENAKGKLESAAAIGEGGKGAKEEARTPSAAPAGAPEDAAGAPSAAPSGAAEDAAGAPAAAAEGEKAATAKGEDGAAAGEGDKLEEAEEAVDRILTAEEQAAKHLEEAGKAAKDGEDEKLQSAKKELEGVRGEAKSAQVSIQKARKDGAKKEEVDKDLQAAIASVNKILGKGKKASGSLDSAAQDAKEAYVKEGKDGGGADDDGGDGSGTKQGDDRRGPLTAEIREKKLEKELESDLKRADASLEGARDAGLAYEADLHPHGHKWWRYRFEYSLVEAQLAILMCILALIWEGLHMILRREVEKRSTLSPFHDAGYVGTMYLSWFSHFGGESIVLVLVLVSVYLLAWIHPDIFLFYVQIGWDPKLHHPTYSADYRILAMEVAIHLSIAILMYYTFCFLVVASATRKFQKWSHMEQQKGGTGGFGKRLETKIDFAKDEMEYLALKEYFIDEVNTRPELLHALNKDGNTQTLDKSFPFWRYLGLNVRMNMGTLYQIRLLTWVFFLLSFVVFMLVHRFLHVGFIELFVVIAVILMMILAGMAFLVRSVAGTVVQEGEKDVAEGPPKREKGSSIHERYNTEFLVSLLVQYALFFLCYGFARTIFSPWMWQLYFWSTLVLTVVMLLFVIGFAYVMAPLVPVFMAAMACPPYVDPGNAKHIVDVLKDPNVMPTEDPKSSSSDA